MLTIDYEHEVVGAQHAAPSFETFASFVLFVVQKTTCTYALSTQKPEEPKNE